MAGAVATALWAVFAGVKRSEELDQPQSGGYKIYETTLNLARDRLICHFSEPKNLR
jgi:hypothetical protein